jgi:hypothetical protein
MDEMIFSDQGDTVFTTSISKYLTDGVNWSSKVRISTLDGMASSEIKQQTRVFSPGIWNIHAVLMKKPLLLRKAM